MGRNKPSRPTDAELAILNVLWIRPNISIREIARELKKLKPTTYATTQTLVRIMEKKGLVKRGEERYPAFYNPTTPEAVAKKALVRDFADRAFGGSVKKLVLQAVTLVPQKKNNAREWAEVQRIVESIKD
jgi:BlaI family transcriptional regulator, penicillinase repressor